MRAAEYDVMRRVEDDHWWYRVQRALVLRELRQSPCQEGAILDAGCGTGGMLALLRDAQSERTMRGIDVEASAIRHCHDRGLQDVALGCVERLPFADASFDSVLSLDVLYHEGVDEELAMREMARVLRPGGRLMLNLPAFDSLRGPHDAAVCGARRYKSCKVRDLLKRHNLQPQMMHYWNAWLFLPLLIWRRVGERLRVTGQVEITSDLRPLPRWVNAMIATFGRLDAMACRALRMPFGTSLFAVAIKPAVETSACCHGD